MNEKPHYIIDGVTMYPKEEMHSFIKKVRTSKNTPSDMQYPLLIPITIARVLHLKKGDMLLIAIKKISEEEIKDYNQP